MWKTNENEAMEREKHTCRLEATQDEHHNNHLNDPQKHLMFYYNKKML
jgi:hypothetical protein